MPRDLTETDRRLLTALQTDGRATMAELGERLGMQPSPLARRLKALEEAGVVTGYRATLDRRALGLGVEAYAFVKLQQSSPDWRTRLIERLKAFPEVISCTALAGEHDLLVRVVAKDLDDYAEFTLSNLLTLPGVLDVRSSFVLSELIPERGLPVR